MGEYFDLLGTNDPDETAKAVKLAAPKSIAAAYAQYRAAVAGSTEDDGGDPSAETTDTDGGAYISCSDPRDDDTCTKYADIEVVDGALSNFTVNGKKVEGRISLGQGDTIRAGSLADIEFVNAYRTITSETLFVNLNMRSNKKSIEIDSFGATYRDPTGRQIKVYTALGLTQLDGDSNTRITLQFKKGKPGGTVTLPISDSNFNKTEKVKIKVG